jgi:hypothetical protein
MATALMGGITVATVLTLAYLPALYAFWFRVHRDEAPLSPRGGTTESHTKQATPVQAG